ncbi:MAG: S8 family serine peptidase [Longimicrobiaceae bacterium]
MRRFTPLALVLAFVAVAACDDQPEPLAPDAQTVTRADNAIPGQYIVVFKDDAALGGPAGEVPGLARALAAEFDGRLRVTYQHALKGFAANLTPSAAAALARHPAVAYVEEDQVVALAPPCWVTGSCEDDGGGGGGQTTPWGITRVGGPVDGTGRVAWIIDTGIDLDHPDLNVDVARSAEFVSTGPGSDTPDDGNGHGTHVAGTVAAINNDIDVVGVAAGATVVAVKVLNDQGSGSYSDVIAGIDYVAANAAGGDVANMSLGGGTSDAVDDAVRNAADQGVFFALAAGNDGEDANNYSPARVEYQNVWTVSAFDDTDTFASFSNWSGPTNPPIEFGGPGVSVLSLYKDGGTRTLSGTSMSSPHIAGILLMTGGAPTSDGTVSGDPDGDPDPIGHL